MDKKAVHLAISSILERKFKSIDTEIRQINEGLEIDTKNSAGDKFETSRAMAQLELDKLRNTLKITKSQIESHNLINTEIVHLKVGLGSLVETNEVNFYISISLGKIIYNSHEIMVISSAAPIVNLMRNKVVGDNFQFNSRQYEIQHIS